MLPTLIIAIIIAAIALIGISIFILKNISVDNSSSQEELINEIKKSEKALVQFVKNKDYYASKLQMKTLVKMIEEIGAGLKGAQDELKEIEIKLDTQQETIERKEAQQQELKSINLNDEERLKVLLSSYGSISQEATDFEHRIGVALKKIDELVQDPSLDANQKDVAEKLAKVLGSTGSLLRNLITEYGSINSRIEQIVQQQTDLEDEYTRLVEQQLGEEDLTESGKK